MTDPKTAHLDELRTLLTGERAPAPIDLEGTYSAIGQLLLDALFRGDRGQLDDQWRRLRRIYELLAAGSEDGYETQPLFNLGRVVELVELTGAAAERSPPASVTAALADENYRHLLTALRVGPQRSRDLEKALGWDAGTVSRRLNRLAQLGLVLSRTAGQSRVSRLTLLGEQALAGSEERDVDESDPFWRGGEIARPVAV